jgi:hypothetical protein
MRYLFLVAAVFLTLKPSGAEEVKAADGGSDSGKSASTEENWMQRFDRLWPQRDQKKVFDELYDLAKARQVKDPKDFEANWRLAAVLVWQADGLPDGGSAKASSGKHGWDYADKAIEVRPNDARAQYYAATGIGLYSEGVGILTALGEGLEGKFKSHAQAALKLDKNYLDGAPQVLWGRYFFKLPWPKRDVGESIKILQACVQEHPTNLRAKLYLAESLLNEGKKAEAKKLIEEITTGSLGTDAAEGHRIKARAAEWMKEHRGDLG